MERIEVYLVRANEDRLPAGHLMLGKGPENVTQVYLFDPADDFDLLRVEDVTTFEELRSFFDVLKRTGWWDEASDLDHRMLESAVDDAIPRELFEEFAAANQRFIDENRMWALLMEIEDAAAEEALSA